MVKTPKQSHGYWRNTFRRIPIDLPVNLRHVNARQPASATRASDALATECRISCTVNRTNDELLAAVEKLARLPIHLNRHMHTAIEKPYHLAIEPRHKRRRFMTKVPDAKNNGLPFLQELRGRAQVQPLAYPIAAPLKHAPPARHQVQPRSGRPTEAKIQQRRRGHEHRNSHLRSPRPR